MMRLFDLGRLFLILAIMAWLVTWSQPASVIAGGATAKRNAEHVLSGIDVSGTVRQVVHKYGNPDRVVSVVNDEKAPEGSGERHYLWTKGNTKMSVTTQHYLGDGGKEIESKTFAIEVIGDAPVDDRGTTGAGLSLGDTLERARECMERTSIRARFTKLIFTETTSPCRRWNGAKKVQT